MYVLTSIGAQQATGPELSRLTWAHWAAIQNGVHRVRDEARKEDALRARQQNLLWVLISFASLVVDPRYSWHQEHQASPRTVQLQPARGAGSHRAQAALRLPPREPTPPRAARPRRAELLGSTSPGALPGRFAPVSGPRHDALSGELPYHAPVSHESNHRKPTQAGSGATLAFVSLSNDPDANIGRLRYNDWHHWIDVWGLREAIAVQLLWRQRTHGLQPIWRTRQRFYIANPMRGST